MRPSLLPLLSRALVTGLLAASLTVVTTSPARAAGNANAKIMLHALGTTTKSQCDRSANIPSTCAGYNAGVDNVALYPAVHFTYLLVVNGSLAEGVAGMQCGIAYPGGFAVGGGNTPINVFSWTLCATLEFTSGGWPSPGSGNLIAWNVTGPQCTTPPGNATIGAVGVAGYFYMAGYGPGQMRVTKRPVDNVAKVANCGSIEDIVISSPEDSQTNLGAIGFATSGINPCGREPLDAGCIIQGPDEVLAGQTGIVFTTVEGGARNWSISGNGTIDGPANQATVTVNAGAPGTFTLTASSFLPCSKTVTVHALVPTTPTSWGRIKSLTLTHD